MSFSGSSPPRISSPWSHPHRTPPTLSTAGVTWKRKGVRCFSIEAQAILYSDTGQTQQPLASSILDRFINGEPLPNSSHLVDLKSAWAAFTELRKQSSLPPSPSLLIAFVDRALSAVEETLTHRDRLRELVRWSIRLRRALRQLGNIESLPSAESVHASCLLARIEALLGRFDEVVAHLHRIRPHPASKKALVFNQAELRMVQTVLGALLRYRDAVAVLDFIVSQWRSLGSHASMSPSRRNAGAPAELNDIIFKALDHIPSPVAVVADRRGRSEKDVTRAGSLLIRYLILRRIPEDALAVYKEMRRHSLDIKPPLKLWLVRALVQSHAIEQANTLFSEISASTPLGHKNELFLATALHLFASQGDTTRSEEAFKALEDKKVVDSRTIGLRLVAHANNGDVETVLRHFHCHFPRSTKTEERPDIYHYTAVLMAHSKACDSAGLHKWFGNMIADDVKPDRHVYNLMLEDRAQRGTLEDVASIIREMHTRGLPPLAEAYTTVITALGKRGDPVAAEAFYKRALREGVKPDRQMVASLMTAHSEVGSWKGVIRVFDYLTSSEYRHLRPRIDVYNILLRAYVLAGSPFEVVSDVFQKMEQSGVQPTVHTFSILIKSACDSGQMDVATRVFMELDSLAQVWETGYKVNVYALTILMEGYLRLGDQLKAKEIYDEMLYRGIAPTSVTYNSILRGYTSDQRHESVQLACDFLKSLTDSSDQSHKWLSASYNRFSGFENIYSPLMTMFARRAKPDQVEELMDDMVSAGGRRTLATLTLLLNAYRNAGNVDECRRVWDEILPVALRFFQTGELFGDEDADLPRQDLKRRSNIICVPLSIHMDALSAAGEHAEVADVWKSIRAHGFGLDSHNWNHLIVVLVRAGEIERAFQILERVIIPLIQRQVNPVDPIVMRELAPRTPLSYDEVPSPRDAAPAPGASTSALTIDASPSSPIYVSAVERASAVQLARARLGRALNFPLTPPPPPPPPITTPTPTPTAATAGDNGSSSDTSSSAQRGEPPPPDFAHPLHILQQILPSWNSWQPHAAVVTLLTDVLDQLEAGHMIPPVPPARRFPDQSAPTTSWQGGGGEGSEIETEAARALLGKLHATCPQGITLLREYEYRIRVRRELAEMMDEG
jgi:pentatricopeptide repeat-containing protein PET309